MYYREEREQLSIEEFFQPFGGRLRKANRWVRLAAIMPWEYIEKVYIQNLSEGTGRQAISSRVAFGAIFIKEYCHFTYEGTVQELQENSYMQYFVGLHEFHAKPSRAKGKANRNTAKKEKERRKKNQGKLLLDATVALADIKYPTDIDLLNKSREHLETAVNILWQYVEHPSRKLPYSAKKARKSYLKLAKSKKWTQAKCRKAIGEQLRYIELASSQLQKYASMVLDYEKLFPSWLRDRLSVIPAVYRQQKEMYDNHSHTCEDRIVSLEQPHVRPI